MTQTVFSAKDKVLPGVRYVIAVASGKGGVGKSTISANLAIALKQNGFKVGLLDADVYGPSIPTILGITEKPQTNNEGKILPVEKYGIKVISTGFFLPVNEAVVWRGPMLHKMIQDLLSAVHWGELDYLVVDLPPGTGDVQLSLCQTIGITGAMIVSTPQEVAWNIAQKAIVMFDKLKSPILGIIENMSRYVCSHCQHEEALFGEATAKKAAKAMEIAFLGEMPLTKELRENSDKGVPAIIAAAQSDTAKRFLEIARSLDVQVQASLSKPSKSIPAKISPSEDGSIEIVWSDASVSTYNPKKLRFECPCASCVNEITGQKMIRLEDIRDDMKAISVSPVGSYALMIQWSDGHNTGLYGYDYLKRVSASAAYSTQK